MDNNLLTGNSLRICRQLFSKKIVINAALGWAIVSGGVAVHAQDITAANLEPFFSREVGTTSNVKTVRISLTRDMAISSIAIAPGFTEFSITTPISDCVVDGHTVNPAFTGCQLGVTFTPKYPGTRTAPLIVTDSSNGKKYSIGLTGFGLAPQAALTPGTVSVIAGDGGQTGSGNPAISTYMYPADVAVDNAGNVYIADNSFYYVYKVNTSGILTIVAGNGQPGQQAFHGNGGPALNASITPNHIALDAAGNLYISSPFRIVRVNVAGIITAVAGNGDFTTTGDGGPAVDAGMEPTGMTIDSSGNLYIADAYNSSIRKVDTNGIITTVAGNGTAGESGVGGPALSAELDLPVGVAVDNAGNLYIAEEVNNRVSKVDTNGTLTVVAGTGYLGSGGDGGPATEATFWQVMGVAVDAAANIYVLDSVNAFEGNNRIRRIDATGTIHTIAGGLPGVFNGSGLPATQTTIYPNNVSLDSAGNLYIADFSSHFVIKVDVSHPSDAFASTYKVGTVSPAITAFLTNTGNQHLDMGTPSTTGDFGLLFLGETSDCAATADLGAGFSCALRITFAPTAAGKRTGTVSVPDNSLNVPGTIQTMTLTGKAINP